MIAQKEIRWGIIGGGNVVETKSGPAFNIPDKSCAYAVFRREQEAAELTRQKLGAERAYSSLDEFLKNPLIDIVYIAIPPGLHFEYAMKCLSYKKAVYVEKPITTSYHDAIHLIEAFDQENIPLFVAHYRRALKRFIFIKNIISEEMGNITQFHYQLFRKRSDDEHHPWLYIKELSGGGKFADIGTHSLDMFQYLFGDIESVSSYLRHISAPNGTEDAVSLSLKFVNGIVGSANYNFLSLDKKDHLVVYGEDKTLEFSLHGNVPIILTTKSGKSVYDMPFPDCIEQDMIQQIVDYLRDLPSTPCFGKDALPTVKWMHQILNGPLDEI